MSSSLHLPVQKPSFREEERGMARWRATAMDDGYGLRPSSAVLAAHRLLNASNSSGAFGKEDDHVAASPCVIRIAQVVPAE